MKTPMQEFIEYIISNGIVYNKDLILKIKELYEKEKRITIYAINQNEKQCVEYVNRVLKGAFNFKEDDLFRIDKKAGENLYNKIFTKKK